MARYPRLAGMVLPLNASSAESEFTNKIVPYLVDIWIDDYTRNLSSKDIVETRSSAFSYLFDIEAQRLIAAWGISQGRDGAEREKSRMRRHPLSAGSLYHRGHAIRHTLGGPTDINLVPQLARINNGPFKVLENRAVATPGSFYFTYWIYIGAAATSGGHPGQTPTGVDQGLLVPGQCPDIDHHGN